MTASDRRGYMGLNPVDFGVENVDLVRTFRNLHNWMKAGDGDLAFETMYRTLKPGGILGVVEHRADAGQPTDQQADGAREAAAPEDRQRSLRPERAGRTCKQGSEGVSSVPPARADRVQLARH